MANKGAQYTVCILAGIGALYIAYLIYQNTDDSTPVPSAQGEAQMMGLGVQASMRVNAGTPLDTSHEIHGWHPGYDPDPSSQVVTQSKHRYPAVPGGNISTVMHNGWSQMCNKAPAGQDWFLNPPEASVL